MLPELSVFKDATTNTPFDVPGDVATLVGRIRSEKYRPQTDQLRSLAPDSPDAKKHKRTAFIGVTWSGTFYPTRAKANLQTHSGLICIDLDKLPPERLTTLHGLLIADEFTHVLFISPSGNGLKCVVRIDYQQPADHDRFYRQICNYYRDCYGVTTEKDKVNLPPGEVPELDSSGSDVSRLCFLPCDPDCFHNPGGEVMPLLDEYASVTETPASVMPRQPTYTSITNNRRLERCTNLIRNASDGNKHAELCKAAYLAGGFIASGMVGEADAIEALEDAIRAKPNVADLGAALKTIRAQIEVGKTKPVVEDVPMRATYKPAPVAGSEPTEEAAI